MTSCSTEPPPPLLPALFQNLRHWHIDDDMLHDRLRDALLGDGLRHLRDLFQNLWHWYIAVMLHALLEIDDLLVDPLGLSRLLGEVVSSVDLSCCAAPITTPPALAILCTLENGACSRPRPLRHSALRVAATSAGASLDGGGPRPHHQLRLLSFLLCFFHYLSLTLSIFLSKCSFMLLFFLLSLFLNVQNENEERT